MGQEQDYRDQSDLDKTQPSPPYAPRKLDWRPPDYQSGGAEPPPEMPPVRRVSRPEPRRRRPPTEGAPAWVVGLGVGALLAVIVLLVVAFVFSRRSTQTETEPSPTPVIVTPTPTLIPRPTNTIPSETTATPEAAATEEAAATLAPPPGAIAVGGYVRIAASAGVKFRASPGTGGELIELLNTGTVLAVIGGPQQTDDLTWWQLRKPDDSQEGWAAEKVGEDILLEPAPAP